MTVSILLLLLLPFGVQGLLCQVTTIKNGSISVQQAECPKKADICFRNHDAYRHDQETLSGCMNFVSNGLREKCSEKSTDACYCNTEMCNVLVEKQAANDNNELSIGQIVGIVSAVLIIVLAALIILGCCYCRRKNKANQSSSDYEPIESVKSVRSQRKSVAYKIKDTETTVMEHDDYSSLPPIEPILEIDEKQELIDSLSNPQAIPGYDELQAPAQITKLQTYSTTDTITILEDFMPSQTKVPSDDADFCIYMLSELINNGPRQYAFKLDELKRVLIIGEKYFAAEPSLLTIQVPCTIYGDIHGQYSDLLRWLNVNGWPNRRRSLFLGDFVDRGSHGVEVIVLLCCLKAVFPKGLYICRGNHEEESLNKAYSFYDEVQHRFKDTAVGDKNLYMHFKKVFMQLPLAATVGKKILAMHGGISPKLKSLQDILDIKRPIDDFAVGSLACDLVWSDPDVFCTSAQFRPNYDREPKSGIGQLFSSNAVQEACQRLDIDMVVRGHQAPLHGYARWAGGRLLTLFSAPGYKGESAGNVNKGACMDVSETGELVIKQIQVSEEFRKKRIADYESQKQRRSNQSS